MAARTNFQSLEETCEGLISRKSSKLSMGICLRTLVIIIVVVILVLMAFGLHCIHVLREDLHSMGVQVDHMENQLEELSHRLDAVEQAEFITNQSITDDSSGSNVLDQTSVPSGSPLPPPVRVLLPSQRPQEHLKHGKVVALPGSQADEVVTTGRDFLNDRMIGPNVSFSEIIGETLKDHNRILKILSKRKCGLILFCD